MLYDCIIIGSGPAGFSASLNLKIHQKSFLWFGSKNLSDKIRRAELVQNYPALSSVTGEEMANAFQKQMTDMGIEITEGTVNSVMKMGGNFAVMAGADFYEAKSIILALGVLSTAQIEGEQRLLGRGVSYCATCDGTLYKNKTIAVISTNARFEHEVKYLSELAEKIHFFPRYKNASKIADNVETVLAKIERIEGENRVEALILGNGEKISLDGVFCLRESIALSAFLPELETNEGHIKVNKDMSTNIEGCFAAGDCTGRPYQYAKAVGEGNIAAHSAIEYLSKE